MTTTTVMVFRLSFERLNGQKVVTIDATTSYEIGLFSRIIIHTKDEIYIFDFFPLVLLQLAPKETLFNFAVQWFFERLNQTASTCCQLSTIIRCQNSSNARLTEVQGYDEDRQQKDQERPSVTSIISLSTHLDRSLNTSLTMTKLILLHHHFLFLCCAIVGSN